MKYLRPLLVGIFLLATCLQVFAQADSTQTPIKILRNEDVLRMYQAGAKPGEIIGKIVTSHCLRYFPAGAA